MNEVNTEAKRIELSSRKEIVLFCLYSFISITIAFAPDYSLRIPLQEPLAALGWFGIIAFSVMAVYNLSNISFKNLFQYIGQKINEYSSIDKNSKNAQRLAMSGMLMMLLAVFIKTSALAQPLLISAIILMIWSILVFFEESRLIQSFVSYSSTKKIIGLLSAILIFWASYSSLAQVNAIFGVDPALFPYSTAVGIFINIAKVLALTSVPVLIISFLFCLLNFFTSNHKFWNDSRLAIMFCSLISSLITAFLLPGLWSNQFQDDKLLQAAEAMDMNGNHLCHNDALTENGKKIPVIFMGPNSSIVLAKKGNKFDIFECNPLNK